MLFKGAQHFPDPLARHAEGLSNLGALDAFLIGFDDALAEGFLGRKRQLSAVKGVGFSRNF